MDETHRGHQGPSSEFVEIIKTVVYALLIAFVIRVLLFQPFTIPSASMEPTLFQGDQQGVDDRLDDLDELAGRPAAAEMDIVHGATGGP